MIPAVMLQCLRIAVKVKELQFIVYAFCKKLPNWCENKQLAFCYVRKGLVWAWRRFFLLENGLA